MEISRDLYKVWANIERRKGNELSFVIHVQHVCVPMQINNLQQSNIEFLAILVDRRKCHIATF